MTTVTSCHAPSIWKKMRWKSLCLLILKSITEIIKYFKSLYDFGGRCLKIKDVCMDFEPYFKVHNLVSVHPKSVILGQMTNLNMVFDMVVSVYRLVKILKLSPVPWWISERLIEIASQINHYFLLTSRETRTELLSNDINNGRLTIIGPHSLRRKPKFTPRR